MAAMQRKVHRQKSASPATPPPRFALVMHEDAIVKHAQMIPLKSSMIFGDGLSDFATLTVPNGKAWRVRLKKCAEHIWFCDGLKEFIEYYKIHYASIVHFTYQGSSSFHVSIFDAMGSEIDYPHLDGASNYVNYNGDIDHNYENMMHDDGTNDNESFEVLDIKPLNFGGSPKSKASNVEHVEKEQNVREGKNCFPPRKRGRPPKYSRVGTSMAIQTRSTRSTCRKEDEANRLKEINLKSQLPDSHVEHEEYTEIVVPLHLCLGKSRKPKNMSKETEKAICAARMCKLKNPSFMAILSQVNVIQKFVTVPVDFVKRHLDRPSEEEYIQLEVHNGKQKWPVRYYSNLRYTSSSFKRLGTGWSKFSSDNNLEEGDVCVFELITKEENNILLRVWIYRAAEYAGEEQKPFKAK